MTAQILLAPSLRYMTVKPKFMRPEDGEIGETGTVENEKASRWEAF
ncbi:TPA: hypothetical protein NPO98_003832 [Klebsiella quasipneumoniae subsp. similipneumoniae]|nr:hypothetical protein [Klebsiella quasipneumoniae subsp. similipneumoniae]